MCLDRAPLVSVIIPNYNHSLYLKERIDSVLNQDYSNIEVILLDDCSSDNSVKIIESYRDNPKVSQICINTKNSGSTFKQWEKGINLANGEYIWIAESDDSADPRLLSTLMKGLLVNSDNVIGFCNSVVMDSNSRIIPRNLNIDDTFSSLYTIHNGVDFIRNKMLYSNRIHNASAVVFKKIAWGKVNKEYMTYRLCGDWYFWLSILVQGNVVWVHKEYNRCRKHQNKVTSKSLKEGINYKEWHSIVKYLDKLVGLSLYEKCSILGVIYVSLLRNKEMEPATRKSELKSWLHEYPLIPLCSIFRTIQYCLQKTRFIRKYRQPKILC